MAEKITQNVGVLLEMIRKAEMTEKRQKDALSATQSTLEYLRSQLPKERV